MPAHALWIHGFRKSFPIITWSTNRIFTTAHIAQYGQYCIHFCITKKNRFTEGSTRLDLAKAFADAETDKSGTLDKEQFKSILSVVGIEDADESQLETIIAMIDFESRPSSRWT